MILTGSRFTAIVTGTVPVFFDVNASAVASDLLAVGIVVEGQSISAPAPSEVLNQFLQDMVRKEFRDDLTFHTAIDYSQADDVRAQVSAAFESRFGVNVEGVTLTTINGAQTGETTPDAHNPIGDDLKLALAIAGVLVVGLALWEFRK